MIQLKREVALSKILLSPVFTEKTGMVEAYGQFVFKARVDATKDDIREAVEHFFKVDVVKVRTAIVKGKVKRTRHGFGKVKNYKRAIVHLKEGQTIALVEEGVS